MMETDNNGVKIISSNNIIFIVIETIVFSSTRASLLDFPSELEVSVLSIKNEYPNFNWIMISLFFRRHEDSSLSLFLRDIIKLFNFKNKYTFKALKDDDDGRQKKMLDCPRHEEINVFMRERKGLLRKTRKSKVDKEKEERDFWKY